MIDFALPDTAVAAFHRDGFVVIERLIDADTVARLRQRFSALFDGEFESGLVPDEVNWRRGRDPDSATRQICNAWKGDRFVAAVALDPAIGRACARLGGWRGARINQDNVFWKPPGGSAVGFHQDSSYEEWVVPSDMVSCWIALDDTSADGGTVEYVRGSHAWPLSAMIAQFHGPDDVTGEMLAAARRAGVRRPERVPVEVPAGGAAFHHGRTWHGSAVNHGKRPRRSLVAHCMSSDARHHTSRIGSIYSRYKRFGDDTLDESFFPVLWREDGYRSPFLDAYTRREIGWGGTPAA